MRNEGRAAADRQNVLNNYDHHSSLLGRTCEALAILEVHMLHALGKQELVDGTCEREGKREEKEKMRNEEARAAEPSCVLMRIISFLNTAEDVPITWSRPNLMRISLVSAPSLDSSGSAVRHTNASALVWVIPSYTSAVAFAGHSIAATSIFTPVS